MRRGSRIPIGLLLVALLATPASAAGGRFVCVRGMEVAGAACPMCHGEHAVSANPCCKWVEGHATTRDATVGSGIVPPSGAGAAVLVPAVSTTIAPAIAGDAMRAATLAPRSSPPRSSILRL